MNLLAPPEFHPIDQRFAHFISGLSSNDPDMKLAAALVSHARSLGHICLDLHALATGGLDPALLALAGESFPKPADWIEKLRRSNAVGRPGEFKPLIIDDIGRLYLHRYWQYETELAASLKNRANLNPGPIDTELLRTGLKRLFPGCKPGEIDWQMVAAVAALRNGLCVISGGPGTGKTRTVVVLLALMLEQQPGLRIALAAPTGKAAARLQESIKQTKELLDCPPVIKAKVPEEAKTIHRLLGPVPDSAYFQHNAEAPLPLDVVVVDEASMVDLALMAKLVLAMPLSARLILLGDKDQLASVEAGAVLADICGEKEQFGYSDEFRESFQQLTGSAIPPPSTQADEQRLSDCIVELRRNYRFGNDSCIYRLSQAVNDADTVGALIILKKAAALSAPDLSSRALPAPTALKEQLRPVVRQHFEPYLSAKTPAEALNTFGRFKILSALRGGPYGVENLNLLVQEILAESGLISGDGAFYPGRPVMVTRNDYNLKLFNGDIGVILPDPVSMQLRAWFPGAEAGKTRSYLPLRLPEHETAFALTAHKSQGSEFERVLLMLPNEDSRVLTRELVYTGLTRASLHVEIWYQEPLLRAAITRKTLRRSGLRDALWGTAVRTM